MLILEDAGDVVWLEKRLGMVRNPAGAELMRLNVSVDSRLCRLWASSAIRGGGSVLLVGTRLTASFVFSTGEGRRVAGAVSAALFPGESVYLSVSSSSSESDDSIRMLFSCRSEVWKLLSVRLDAFDVRVWRLDMLAAQSVGDCGSILMGMGS
jgi:hypothetical protein